MSFCLQSERLIIRAFTPEDETAFINIHLQPAVNAVVLKRNEEDHAAFFRAGLNPPDAPLNRWAMIEKITGNFVGSCLLREFNPGDDTEIEIGYGLDEPYRGNGLASEMAKLITNYAFTLPATEKVIGVTDPENKGSQAVLLKTGFTEKGTFFDYDEQLTLSYFEYEPEMA